MFGPAPSGARFVKGEEDEFVELRACHDEVEEREEGGSVEKEGVVLGGGGRLGEGLVRGRRIAWTREEEEEGGCQEVVGEEGCCMRAVVVNDEAGFDDVITHDKFEEMVALLGKAMAGDEEAAAAGRALVGAFQQQYLAADGEADALGLGDLLAEFAAQDAPGRAAGGPQEGAEQGEEEQQHEDRDALKGVTGGAQNPLAASAAAAAAAAAAGAGSAAELARDAYALEWLAAQAAADAGGSGGSAGGEGGGGRGGQGRVEGARGDAVVGGALWGAAGDDKAATAPVVELFVQAALGGAREVRVP